MKSVREQVSVAVHNQVYGQICSQTSPWFRGKVFDRIDVRTIRGLDIVEDVSRARTSGGSYD